MAVCLDCIRTHSSEALEISEKVHAKSRTDFGLPETPPKDPGGLLCNLCVNQCRIPEKGTGYCGLRRNTGKKLAGVRPAMGKVSWYHDPLPTNCVGDWICPGGTGAGYPDYANCRGPERGYKNLAVFFQACTFNCLFCQNWHFKNETLTSRMSSVDELVADVDQKTSCICYFGGDPSPQIPFSLRASKKAIAKKKDGILRICWETNGSMNQKLLDRMMEMALLSGGCIKFDLKAWDESLHLALTGVTNRQTIDNFKHAGKSIRKRPLPHPLIASTLLIPGYIDEKEIGRIAHFIASIDSEIPYSLLAFHPQFYMSDMPLTSKTLANNCLEAAKSAGLENVRIGNVHLLQL
jgi:pyruvate formate lyase activating enzyme